jgi:O-antigen ligase
MGFVAPLFSVTAMGIVAWRGNGLRSAGLVGLLAAGLAVCFVALPSDQLISRFAQAKDDMTAEGRTELWKESLGLVRAYPVFGCGLGAYESAFLRFKVSVPLVSDDRAHNDYLQFLIELGAAGFVIGLALMGSIVARTWRSAARSADPDSRFLAIGCIGAMAAIGLHSLVDFNLYVPANAMLLAWICGVALSIRPGTGARNPRNGRLPVTIDVTAVPNSWQ